MCQCGSTGHFLNLQWPEILCFFCRTETQYWACVARSVSVRVEVLHFCCVTVLSHWIYDFSFFVSARTIFWWVDCKCISSSSLFPRLTMMSDAQLLWQVSQFQRPKTWAITCLCENVKVLQRPAITGFLPTPWQPQSSRSPWGPVPTCHALLFLQVSQWFWTNVIYG